MKFRCFILMIALCLLPVTALAAIEPSDGVDRSGTTITLSGEQYTISGSEQGVAIVVESGVKRLKLDNANIAAPDGRDALKINGSLQLDVLGSNTITGGSSYTDGGSGIVLPAGGTLTINGIGSLNVTGGDALYERDESAIDGKAGTAIVGSIAIQGDVHVTVTGGGCQSGYHEEDVQAGNGVDGDVIIDAGRLTASGGSALNADHECTAGHGVAGNVVVNAGQMIATGGQATEANYNKGGDGVRGSVEVNGGQLTATGGQAFEGGNTGRIDVRGGNGVFGDAKVNGGKLTATGGQASGGKFTQMVESTIQAGHGVHGNAVVNGGQLIATGNSASSPKTLKNITGGNGINGAFTAAGGYVLATGGEGNSDRMGKAAAATEELPVTIGSSGKLLAAAVGAGTIPDTWLNNGEFYTAATKEMGNVSGKRFLETKEYFTVSYSCAYDGCEDIHKDYADGSKPYTVKTPASIGFQDHGLIFAGFSDNHGNVVDSLTVSGPVALKACWKVVFSFDAGEGGADSVPPIDVINSGGMVRLPECTFAAPAGYRFAGWMIDGGEEIYAEGDEVPAAGEIHLTAVWERIPALPDTGDSAMPALWMLLCLGSCAMLLMLRRKAGN